MRWWPHLRYLHSVVEVSVTRLSVSRLLAGFVVTTIVIERAASWLLAIAIRTDGGATTVAELPRITFTALAGVGLLGGIWTYLLWIVIQQIAVNSCVWTGIE